MDPAPVRKRFRRAAPTTEKTHDTIEQVRTKAGTARPDERRTPRGPEDSRRPSEGVSHGGRRSHRHANSKQVHTHGRDGATPPRVAALRIAGRGSSGTRLHR